MRAEHALAALFRVEIQRPGLEQISERNHPDESATLAVDDRKARQPGLRHAVDDDAERLIRIGDDRRGLDDGGERRVGAIGSRVGHCAADRHA